MELVILVYMFMLGAIPLWSKQYSLFFNKPLSLPPFTCQQGTQQQTRHIPRELQKNWKGKIKYS